MGGHRKSVLADVRQGDPEARSVELRLAQRRSDPSMSAASIRSRLAAASSVGNLTVDARVRIDMAERTLVS
jgi:hypothetical protein